MVKGLAEQLTRTCVEKEPAQNLAPTANYKMKLLRRALNAADPANGKWVFTLLTVLHHQNNLQ